MKQIRTIILFYLILFFSLPVVTFGIKPAKNNTGFQKGDIFPNISSRDVEGKLRKISDLKGKLVFVDFWASWCGSCRKDNPEYVRIYKKYKNVKFKKGKGFEVFSISIDSEMEQWINAINKDQLSWKSNVSDLAGSRSYTVKMAKIKSIPANFLIDKKRKIIAINITPEKLEQYLKKYGKKK